MKKIFLFFLLSFGVISAQYVYQDSSASIEDRVNDLLSRMTLQEKIGQMVQADVNAIGNPQDIINYNMGSILSGGGSDPANNATVYWADMYDSLQAIAMQSRLGIPLIYGVDAVHGNSNITGAVIFPHNIGLGCTRNPELMKRIGEITAYEVAATGIDWTFAPCIAVARNERWGRTYEGFGETTELAEIMGSAIIEGLQGDTLSDPTSVLACAKHYLADGGTVGGDDQGNAVMSEDELRAIHLPGYIKAIESGVGTVMASFSSWNGQKMHGNHYLLTEVLKEELGFDGFIISDWAGIDQLPGDYRSDVKNSVNAGMDMVMVPNDYPGFYNNMVSLAGTNEIPVSRIDDAVKRILTQKFKLGLFEHPYANRSLIEKVGSEEHREVARQSVRESIVILKKKDGILPLPKQNSHFQVAGRAANDIGLQCGGWTISWQGSAGNTTEGTTLLEAMQTQVATSQIEYNENGSFSNHANSYSIVVISENPYAEGEGDRDNLELSDEQIALIKKVKANGSPLILLIYSGRPLIIEKALHYADVIVAAWLPGTEGKGITDVLFGDYQPKGILSHTWPKSMEQIPINFGDGIYDPLYEYGYGITSLDDSPTGSSPELLSGIVTPVGNSIELTFNKEINPISLVNAQFQIVVNNTPLTANQQLSLADGDNTTVLVTLDNAFNGPDYVTVSYSGDQIQGMDGGTLQAFEDFKLVNEAISNIQSIPGQIEAEDFTAQYGTNVTTTNDVGGGEQISNISSGDWLEYTTSVANAGTYIMSLRMSSQNSTTRISVESNDTQLFTRELPSTGNAYTWMRVSQSVELNKGMQIIKLNGLSGNFNLNWISFTSTSDITDETGEIKSFGLNQNYPNPFNPSTTITYNLDNPGITKLVVFNSIGEHVKTLVNEYQNTGKYNISFQASDLSSGVYFCELTSGSLREVKKMTLLK